MPPKTLQRQEVDRTCMRAGGIRFGIWVNVSLKGFRIKTIDFPDAGMSTDIPRPLSGASVAVRNIFVPYRFVRGVTGRGAGVSLGGGSEVAPMEGGDVMDAAGLKTVGEPTCKVSFCFYIHRLGSICDKPSQCTVINVLSALSPVVYFFILLT